MAQTLGVVCSLRGNGEGEGRGDEGRVGNDEEVLLVGSHKSNLRVTAQSLHLRGMLCVTIKKSNSLTTRKMTIAGPMHPATNPICFFPPYTHSWSQTHAL